MTIKNLDGPEQTNQYTNMVFHMRGGMGEIYIGQDTINHNDVAIKIVALSDQDEKKLLKSEADIALSLDHRNIVKTHYDGFFFDGNTEYFYVVMEFIANGNLRNFIEKSSLLSLDTCLNYMSQLASGLASAHKIIIHRDLKPENILMADGNILKICDFGLAKFVNAKTRTHTFKGWGTYPYMAPECWLLDANTKVMDIYSLGIIFYELLTLKLPFTGKNEVEFREKHLYEPLPDVRSIRNDLPIGLIEMISKMANKRSKDRYQSADEVLAVIKAVSNTNTSNDSNLESLLAKAHNKLKETEETQLKANKETELRVAFQKNLNYSITQLFNQFKSTVEELNRSLQRGHIIIRENTNIAAESLELSFLSRKVRVNFFPFNNINSFIETARIENLEFQKETYGMVLQKPAESHFKKDGVILIGKVVTSEDSANIYGYNLLLRQQDPTDLYGEWWVCWFEDTALIRQTSHFNHYPLDENDFYKEFEIGRMNAMHVRTMYYEKLEDSVIKSVLERLFD
jgi:eukaryotic-like serine/threonine-protein kinase